ncbi:MAG: HAMP domain-containing sensor histidine kinase [Oricola sp.]
MSSFLAERLIALAAGAVLVVAPVSLLLSGFGLPGTYGAATAIALTFIAIPFLALGWLAISQTPWVVGIFALAGWSALAGTLVSVSPLLALTGGLVLFQVAGGAQASARIRAMLTPSPGAVAEAVAEKGEPREFTSLELTPDGAIDTVDGYREGVFRPRRLFVDHVHLADRIAYLGAFSEVIKQRKPASAATLRVNLAAPGMPQAFRPVRLSLAPSERGVALTLDEPAELALQQETEQGTENAGQRRFLATVSHELRTPLNSIIGFSDILRRDLFGALANDRQREYVELIHSSGAHLLSVVNTILDVSKIDAGTYGIHREAFDLNGMAEECISMLRPQADAKELVLELQAAPEIAEADGDRRAIKQVLINLVSNAVKFTERGGTVRIATERRERGFLIRVTDTGIGMTAEELSMIGTPFMQADNSYTRSCEGTGLGLTVVKGLVQLHGGTLDVESEPGKGTRMTVYIPEAEEITAARLPEARGIKRKANANAVRLAG